MLLNETSQLKKTDIEQKCLKTNAHARPGLHNSESSKGQIININLQGAAKVFNFDVDI